MTAALDLDTAAARECSYCTRGGSSAHPLVADGEGGWMHADPAHCLAVPSTRIGGVDVALDALSTAPRETTPRIAARIDAALVLAGGTGADLDPADLPAKERARATMALRAAVGTLASRVRHAIASLPRHPTRAERARVRELGAELRAGLDALDRWEARCDAVHRGRTGRGPVATRRGGR